MGLRANARTEITNTTIYSNEGVSFGVYSGSTKNLPEGTSFTINNSKVYASGNIGLRSMDMEIRDSLLHGFRINHEGNSQNVGQIERGSA